MLVESLMKTKPRFVGIRIYNKKAERELLKLAEVFDIKLSRYMGPSKGVADNERVVYKNFHLYTMHIHYLSKSHYPELNEILFKMENERDILITQLVILKNKFVPTPHFPQILSGIVVSSDNGYNKTQLYIFNKENLNGGEANVCIFPKHKAIISAFTVGITIDDELIGFYQKVFHSIEWEGLKMKPIANYQGCKEDIRFVDDEENIIFHSKRNSYVKDFFNIPYGSKFKSILFETMKINRMLNKDEINSIIDEELSKEFDLSETVNLIKLD